MSLCASFLFALALFAQAPEPVAVQAPQPTEQNLAEWREYLRPKPSELAFEDCDWKPTFWEAVVEAQARQKPVLLWAMNGHPMACT